MINVNFRQKLILGTKYRSTFFNQIVDSVFYHNQTTPFPRIINCFITEKCNFNCPMCHVKESRNKNMTDLPYETLLPLIEESEKYAPSFQLTGGEPLLHPDLDKIIQLLNNRHLVKGVVTNGLLLEDKAEMLVRTGLDFLAVSIDGYDEKTQYKRGYVTNSFNAIKRGILAVKKLRGKNLFPNIRMATVISEINIGSFDKILTLAEELGVDQWSLSHYFFYPGKIKEMQIKFSEKYRMGNEVWGEELKRGDCLFNQKQINQIIEKYQEITNYLKSRRSKVRVSLQPEVDINKYYSGMYPGKKSICTSPFNQIFIRGNGDAEICQGYILGNVKNEKMKKLWHNLKAKHFRNVFNKNKIMPACFRCCALNIKFN